jgi:hypothetical protein
MKDSELLPPLSPDEVIEEREGSELKFCRQFATNSRALALSWKYPS